MARPLRVLLVEDSEDDARLLCEALRDAGYEPSARRVDGAAAMEAALADGAWDVILADFTLPAFSALEALGIVRSRALDVPFILVSGTIGDEKAAAVMKAGAHDYLLKDRLSRLGFAVEREIREGAARRERRRGMRALQESEERFEKAFRANPAAMTISTRSSGRYIDVNDRFIELLGYTREELIGKTALELGVWQDRGARKALLQAFGTRKVLRGWPVRLRTKSGAVRETEVSLERIDLGEEPCLLAIIEEVTERQRLEEQLRQSQKMDAVGRLAGGVAHDFNNILGVIIGYGELLRRELPEGGRAAAKMDEILKAAGRAATLTRQLLAFSRKQVVDPRVLDLNAVVSDMHSMLQRLIGEDVDLVTVAAPDLWRIKADPAQLEQILMNLAVNARHAMPSGGKLTIETANVALDERYAGSPLAPEGGPHVMLAVADTGVGMDAETRARLFEPFFTTKEQGTGLGLATVYTIVKRSGGSIWVDSEPGQGTTFRIHLPRCDEAAAEAPLPAPPRETRVGSETVLLAEDEEPVRELVSEILRSHGYSVLEASNGREALALAREYPGDLQLLVTDAVMPEMSGRELAESLAETRPELRVLYISGYAAGEIGSEGGLEQDSASLEKPFTPEALVRKVREVLDGSGPP